MALNQRPSLNQRRVYAFFADALGYLGLIGLFYFVFQALPLVAMGDYNEVQRALYLYATPFAYGFFFAQHFLVHALKSASLGQVFFKVELVNAAGQRPTVQAHLMRAGIATAIFPTLILLPGPALGFYLGPGSGAMSLAILALGFAVAWYLSTRTMHDGANWLEQIARMKLVIS